MSEMSPQQMEEMILNTFEAVQSIEDKLAVIDDEQIIEESKLQHQFDLKKEALYKERNAIFEKITEFWIAALRNHEFLNAMMTEKDYEILQNLRSIEAIRDPEDFCVVTLKFEFKPNSFFEETVLEKRIETPIDGPIKINNSQMTWLSGSQPGQVENQKKKQKMLEPEENSFFNFFTEIGEDCVELAQVFISDFIPNVMNYYQGIQEDFSDDEDEDFEDEEEDNEQEQVLIFSTKMFRNFSRYFSHSRILRLFIQIEQTPNPNALKFIPGKQVLPSGSGVFEFMKLEDTKRSPLARSLMIMPGIKSVFFGPDFVTDDSEWSLLKPDIYGTLMEFFSSEQNRPIVLPQDTQTQTQPLEEQGDPEIVMMIQELLDSRIRPAIQSDGGDLEFRGFTTDGTVKLLLKGSCRGCSSSEVTLKAGIENMLKHYIPEVKSVEQVIDESEEIAEKAFKEFEQNKNKE